MFTGDAPGGSGEWLARALHLHGFATQPTSRHRGDGFDVVDAYITAAIHCVPPDNRPLPIELRRCAVYLGEELTLLRSVRVVVALGRIGFDAYLGAAGNLGWTVPRPRPRFAHGAVVELPWGVTLLSTYHPSRQNTQTGRLTWAMFEAVFAEARRRLSDPPTAVARGTPSRRPARARRLVSPSGPDPSGRARARRG
jgi:uracil-DNA glycosylase family 4